VLCPGLDRAVRLWARERRLDQTAHAPVEGRQVPDDHRSRSLVLAITHSSDTRLLCGSSRCRRAAHRRLRSPPAPGTRAVPTRRHRIRYRHHCQGPPVLSVVEQHENAGPWPRRWIPIGARLVVHAPQFIEKSRKSLLSWENDCVLRQSTNQEEASLKVHRSRSSVGSR